MRGRFGWAVPLAALVGAGCSGSTDVVAIGSTTDEAAPPTGLSAIEDPGRGCEAGAYWGRFQGSYGSPQLAVDVDGFIEFELEETLDGEFLVLSSDSRLFGRTTSGVDFSADIIADETRGCREGFFESTLSGGRIAAGELAFEGETVGTYDPETRSFLGTWTTRDPASDATGFGTWTALHVE